MSTIARSLFRSTFNITRHLASDHVQVPHMVRCGNATCWRILDCNMRTAYSITQSTWINKESQEIMAVWPNIVRDVTDAVKSWNIPDVPEWIEKLLQYNVPGGKQIRGLSLIHAYKLLVPSDQLTKENIRLAQNLAWCIEMLQGFLLLIDDMLDQSLLRRGRPCWYRYNDINLAASNDGVLLENIMFYLIQRYFKGKDCYVDLLETFHDITLKTAMGQCLDLLSNNFGKKPNLNLFTMDRYNSITTYKTAYLFILPVISAMNLAGIKDPEMFRQTRTIMLDIGRLYQTQNDYWSCFEDFEFGGKDDNDIQEGKCTWFIVKALECATPEQRKVLEECYGVSDLEKVKLVKQLFVDFNLLEHYLIYEKEVYNALNDHIQQTSGIPHELFWDLLGLVYHKVSSRYNLDWKNK